jgi:hypothetical protein
MPLPRTRSRQITRLAHAAMLATACMLLAAPAAHAAPARVADPVYAAINRAVVRGEITVVDAVGMRATWRMSEHAARSSRTAERRANVAAVRAWTTALARSGQLSGSRLAPAMLSVKATSWAMRYRDEFPSHEQVVDVPDEVVEFKYYAGHGVQVQPFETFKEGMRALNQDEPDVEAARRIADRMLELDTHRGTSTTWEYFFPWNGGGLTRPWTSAISQALATEFYFRLAELVPEAERAPYAQAAAATTRSFLRSTNAGGVATQQGKGSFYVMYSFQPAQRILNGHLQVLLNVSRYAEASGSPEARQVVDAGTRAVLPLLPKFDTGAWSYYLPGSEAELGYHELQTSQLVRLGDATGNQVFTEYGARFTKYLETPPTVSLDSSSWPSIIPARDGFRDRIVVRFAIDKTARVTLVVRDQAGAELYRTSWNGRRGRGSIAWDGRTSAGKVVPDGDYVATLTSTDVAGNRGVDTLPTMLRVARDTIAPAASMVTVRDVGGMGVVSVRASDAGSAWIVARVRVDGRTVAVRRGPRSGSITLRTRRAVAEVSRGEVVLTDSSGNSYAYPL